MATITDRQKDSEIIARLIYLAFVAPERANINIGDVSFIPFAAALELYARTWGKEKRDEESYGMLLRMAAEAGVKPPAETASESDAPPEPEPQPEPPDTHTHTQPGPMTAEADSPSPSPAKDRAKSARSSNTCSALSTPTAAHAAGSPRKPTAH